MANNDHQNDRNAGYPYGANHYGMGMPAQQPYQPHQQYQQQPGAQPQMGQQPMQPNQPVYMQPMYVQPQTSQPQQLKKKRGKGFVIGIAIAIIAIILAAGLAFFYFQGMNGKNRSGALGQLEGKTQEEIQAELNRAIEEGMFNISIASVATFPDGASPGEIKIENVPNNPYLMQVIITRDDTGEQVYESGVLEPNYHVQYAVLDQDLPAGTYPCTATFHALDMQTEEEVGQAAAKMTIVVEG